MILVQAIENIKTEVVTSKLRVGKGGPQEKLGENKFVMT